MRVLGIDASLRNFGFALVDLNIDTLHIIPIELRLVQTTTNKATKKSVRKNSQDLESCRTLVKGLREMEKKAQVVCVEMPHGSQSARSMASYGMCLGVLASCSLPFIQVHAEEVKLAAVGIKTASKEEMIAWATKKYPKASWLKRNGKLVNKNEHLADAMAAIEAGIESDQFKILLSMAAKL